MVAGTPTGGRKTDRTREAQHRRSRRFEVLIDCWEQIPCNPCETVCPNDAIVVGKPITNLPRVESEKCAGCCRCVAVCPGQAVFLVDYSQPGDTALVSLPYEYLPRPESGETVEVYNASGELVGRGRVQKIREPKSFEKTAVLTIEVPMETAPLIRFFRSLKKQNGEKA